MRADLEILQELFLPPLTEVAAQAPALQQLLTDGDVFWISFNELIIDADEQCTQLYGFAGKYDIPHATEFAAHMAALRTTYICHIATLYCAGESTPSAQHLLAAGNASFSEDVAWQKDILAAITLSSHTDIKDELHNTDIPVTDEEITQAFKATQHAETRAQLKAQLKEWDKQPQPTVSVQKPLRSIPFMFFRFAAAAAIFTVTTVTIVKVFESRKKQQRTINTLVTSPVTDSTHHLHSTPVVQPAVNNDTASPEPTAHQATDKIKQAKTKKTSTDIPHQPQIVLIGNIIDLHTQEAITGVTVTLKDDSGKEQTIISADGNFQFILPLHRDIVITGKKDKYASTRISLSTKTVKDTDTDDTIRAPLRLFKEQ